MHINSLKALRPIRNEEDYETALEEIEALWEVAADTPEADRLDILVMLEAYEAAHYPIPNPDPIELILHVMDARGLTRQDLEPYLGVCARLRNSQSPPPFITGNDS